MSYVEKWLQKVQIESGDKNLQTEVNEVECEHENRNLSIDELDLLTRFHPTNRKFSDDIFLGDENVYKLEYHDVEEKDDEYCRPSCSACNLHVSFRGRGRGRGARDDQIKVELLGSDHRLCQHIVRHNSAWNPEASFRGRGRGRGTRDDQIKAEPVGRYHSLHIVRNISDGVNQRFTSKDGNLTIDRVDKVDINHNLNTADKVVEDDKDEPYSSSGSFITCASFKGSD